MTLLAMAVLAPPTICIDPGHISENGAGTRGKVLTELEVCWEIGKKLRTQLVKDGYRVVLTKSTLREKVTNKRRAEIANEAGASLFLRLHCDAASGRGFATFYPDREGKVGKIMGPTADVLRSSKAAAAPFHRAAVAVLKGHLPDAGLKTDRATKIGGQQGALTGSIFARTSTILVEMVVLTNPKDEAFLRSPKGFDKMTEALAAGVRAAVPLR